jgi:hypothetical protein
MRPFAVVVKSDGVCDYEIDAAYGHHVSLAEIQARLAPYVLDDRFTIIFDLNGDAPRLLPNTEKGDYANLARSTRTDNRQRIQSRTHCQCFEDTGISTSTHPGSRGRDYSKLSIRRGCCHS